MTLVLTSLDQSSLSLNQLKSVQRSSLETRSFNSAAVMTSQEASSSDFRYNYQVFLSFRGEDTRKTFTDHLYTALVQAGLRTFRDDDEIERGKRLELELRRAIQQLRISIIVLSKNYASSKWCLDEVVMILEWSRIGGNEVLPIFYDVDPSDVRKQRGSIGESFALHEEEFIDAETDDEIRKKWMEKLKSWRVALKEVANLTGMVLQKEADGHEAKFIQKIVRVVEDKLRRRVLHVGRHLVGLHSRAESINLWVQDKSTDVKILIICGMGGIGKTTIAKYVYNLNYLAFESSVFLASVREKSEQPNGLLHLQQHLLSNILKRKIDDVYNVDEGIIKIEEAIFCKRVLVVLDDVSEVKQLDALLGTREFYPGSKIIITTRYKWLLKANQVHKMHIVEKLDDRDSLELLCWHAFGQNHPFEGYRKLSEKIVWCCGGLPLAYEVLGSTLSGRSVDVWRSTLQKLEAIPDAQILKQLKLSYDYLQDEHDKNLFLHIACFFVGYQKDDMVTILDNCGFYTIVGIQTLIDRCLITIDLENTLTMHQLIQEMGRQIVDQESPLEPGRRSRLWRHKDSLNVLKGKKGTKTIEGLILDLKMLKDDDLSCFNDKNGKKRRYEEFVDEPSLSNQANSLKRRYLSFLSWQSLRSPNEIELTIDGFARMENLLLLQLNYVQLTGCYGNLPQNLRWLCWHGFPLKSIPMDLSMGNIIVLDLSYSKLKQVWKGIKVLGSLKILNLSHSVELAKTPNFLGLPNLEKLILEGCVELIKVCESIGSLEVLTLLNLKGCKRLRKFPNIGKLKFLETLIISGCSKIFEFLEELRNLESLKVFHADGVAINHPLPNAAGEVVLWDPFSWPWLSKPGKSVDGFWASLPRSLVTLSVRKCNLSNDFFPMDLCNLVSLQELDLSRNPLHTVPECIKGLSWLKSLKLNNCTRLHSVLVTNEEYLELAGSKLVERIKFREIEGNSVERIEYNPQTLKRRPELFFTFFSNLLEFAGRFKIEPLEEVEREILNNLAFFNLELIRNLVVRLAYALKPFHTEMAPIQDRPIQGLHEYGIFSTFLPKGEAPSWCSELNVGSSISFVVPLSPNLQIQGLNVCGVYALSNRKETWYPPPLFTRINNKTKDLIWVYNPLFLGIPRDGEEELAWLSHWKLGNELESGDEVTVSIVSGDRFEVKECGINLVWGDQEEKKTSHKLTSELSKAFMMTKGVYLLSNHLFYRPDRNDRTIPSWFLKAFGDSFDFEGFADWCTWEAIEID